MARQRLPGLEEGIEHALQHLTVHADAVVAHRQACLAFLDQQPLLDISGLQWEAERLVYGGRFTGVVCRFTLLLPRSQAASACSIV